MSRRILSVGYDFPGGIVEHVKLKSEQSLLDADIIFFEPGLALGRYDADSEYKGKPSLHESASFQAKERVQHWRRELQAAFNAGKLLIIVMAKPEDVFVQTGQHSTSGTGRNARVTNYVEPLSSYASLPFVLKEVVPATGAGIAPAGDLKYLATLWAEFRENFRFETYFSGELTDVLLKTRSGDRIVGAAIKKGKGAALLLPPLNFPQGDLIQGDENGKNLQWTEKAGKIGRRLLQCCVEISKAIASESQITPAPEWLADNRYRLPIELDLDRSIVAKSAEIERLHAEREKLRGELQDAGSLRRLLFEKGPQLEQAILDALRLLAFKAEPFKDAESEFDAVFISDEGRFLGEAEGKDNHAINIDKLSQLERNIQEDFARPEIEAPAKGVLFGNAYRLQEPAARGDFFTSKCRSGAVRSRTALVATPTLFKVAQYLKTRDDPDYAKACRQAILQAEGADVSFPDPPTVEEGVSHPATLEVEGGGLTGR
jgi:hypothetical protein